MTRQRAVRVAEAIKQEISSLIQRDLKDPGLGFVSITDVETSNDLQYAKVFVSVYGDDQARERSMAALERARGFIRTQVGRRVRLRHTPELAFVLDSSIERGSRIQELLRQVQAPTTKDSDDAGQ